MLGQFSPKGFSIRKNFDSELLPCVAAKQDIDRIISRLVTGNLPCRLLIGQAPALKIELAVSARLERNKTLRIL